MSNPTSTVSAAEISRLAGVTRATVSNWRRRHADFPKSIGGSEARPLFDLREVQAWLAEHGMAAEKSTTTELRTVVRSQATSEQAAHLLDSLRRSGARWTAPGFDAALTREVLPLVERIASEVDVRAAIDILGERALEDTAATGVYITPPWVAELMASLPNPDAPAQLRSVLDPACGSGSLLLAAAEAGAVELYGQDVLPVQAQRTRLLLESVPGPDAVTRSGDSLLADAFPDLRVDAVLTNPPYGQRDWGSGELAFDPRWDYGLPPRVESELAWVQHAIAHLRPGGTAVLLLPPAVATRGSGRKIRGNLVRTGALRAVIGLAPGVAQPWHVGLQIWVLRRPQPAAPVADSILFVDTTGLQGNSDGEDRVITDPVLRVWRAFDGVDQDAATESGLAVVVRLADVLTEDVDLTPARYVRSAVDSDTVSDQVEQAIRQLDRAAVELVSTTGDLGGWATAPGRSWRFVTVADLSNHDQLEWIRSEPPSSEAAAAADMRPVLTAQDIGSGGPASGSMAMAAAATTVIVEAGDILIPAVRSDRTGGRSARIAGSEDAGAIRGPHIHTLRVDADRLDPWFLAGFLTGADNVAATRTATIRFDPSRLRIPVLGIADQRRYGDMFRLLFTLRIAARRATATAEHVAELVTTGLTAGALIPETADDTAPRNGQ
ncbi:N-6 DNA methylase [Nocardia sp. NPDC088792]|uniref:N-6 DNA methylase n=1 Tax=Nocardia sp. NPDC088792 TaxID=3364332 RepID=UPI003800D571